VWILLTENRDQGLVFVTMAVNRSHKMRGIICLPEEPIASEEGLYYVELAV